uniref:XIAP associated factor 1 n=1 Tax=Lepisosteus oculatus TaxID=7918 RepID=W5MIJ4_LEPOC
CADMEEHTGDSRLCRNCKKEVALSNFALHESHCKRFLCVCPFCDEPVPREQMDQHRDTEHKQVRCPQCHEQMEKWQLEEHQAEQCQERLASCQFCQLQVPLSRLPEHVAPCGSRTERCPDCGSYVQLREQEPKLSGATQCHFLCCKESPSELCWYCMKAFPSEQLKEHQRGCDQSSQPSKELQYQLDPRPHFGVPHSAHSPSFPLWGIRGLSWEDRVGADEYEIRACSNCHLALPLATLSWHEV